MNKHWLKIIILGIISAAVAGYLANLTIQAVSFGDTINSLPQWKKTNSYVEIRPTSTWVRIPNIASTSPVNGANGGFLYDTLTNKFRCYENGSWADCIGGGSVSPLTTKGDLYTYTSANARLPVGSDGLCLTASSTTVSGLAWALCATGGTGLSNLNGMSGATQTFATNTTATGLTQTITSAANAHTWNLSLTSGYNIPLTASTTNWNSAFNWGNHATAGYLTSSALTPYLTTTTAASTYEPILTKGNLTATAPLQFDQTRQVIGGAAALSVASGYNIPLTASTTNWNTAYNWGNHASAGYLSGIVPIANGGTATSSAPGASQLLVGNGTNFDFATVPSCSDGTTSKLLYNSTTRQFSCGTDSTGAPGGGITSLNGLTADPQTFATGTATGIGLNITSSASTHTFTPTVTSGYMIPLTASTTNWNTSYNTVTASSTYWNQAYDLRHAAVTLTGENYLTLGTQQITANEIQPANLAAADFGDFTCNGTTCTLDASYLTAAVTNLNGLSGASQTFATSTGGSLWTITSNTTTHTWNIPATPTFTGLTVTNATTSGIMIIPQGASPTVAQIGALGFDTTSNQLQIHDGTAARAIPLFETKSFTISSSSQDSMGTSIPLEAVMATSTVISIKCFVTGGTSVVMNLTDGTNAMDSITCGTSVTSDDGNIANATIQTDDTLKATIGTETGAWNFLTVTVKRRVDPD